MKILKKENGSISLFVLVSMLFFVMYLVGMYMLSANTESSQIAETTRIKEIYEQGVDNIDDVYATLTVGKKVNAPKLGTGMTPVKWDGTKTVDTTLYDDEWYEYIDTSLEGNESKSKWANARTKDGSLWVWIPRFAYKITYTNSDDKSQGGTIDIVFLKGNTNKDFDGNDVTSTTYVNKNNVTGAYIVHPAFKDGTVNGFENGEWDEEITGFWMAKFEAGYEGTAGDAETAIDSTVTLSTIMSWDRIAHEEYASNYYGERTVGDNIKYPVFQANRPSMNYIGINDAYNLCLKLNESNNPYGFTNMVDSHLTKNSEWGAVVYLAHSKYGRNGEEIRINNVSLDGINTVFAVTGYAASTADAEADTSRNLATLSTDNQTGSWTTSVGQLASTTGNIYGIYDLSGGLWEWTAGYLVTTTENDNYNTYGGDLKGNSTKYKSKYEGISATDTGNYSTSPNPTRIGEAIWETSTSGTGLSSWNDNYSGFMKSTIPFSRRGGSWYANSNSGIFAFHCEEGYCYCHIGFRPVLIVE